MSNEQAEKVGVTVLSTVRCDRVLYGPGHAAGDRLELNLHEAERLEAAGVVKRDDSAEKAGALTADDGQAKAAGEAAAKDKADKEAAAAKAAAAKKAAEKTAVTNATTKKK